MNTRRQFLLNCSTAAMGMALVPVGLEFSGRHGGQQPVARLTYSTLSAQLNTRFRLRPPSGVGVELTLLKAELAPFSPIADDRQFSLVFRGPKEIPLPPAIYQFEHEQLGEFEMYIGGIDLPYETELRYEAVFNQQATGATS